MKRPIRHFLEKPSPHRRVLPILLPLLLGAVILGLTLSACQPQASFVEDSQTASPALTPYHTPTPSRTPLPQKVDATAEAKSTAKVTIPPPPTATPIYYEVKKGDTMLGIAFQHGLTVDELQLANPDVDPRWLSVGTRLVIPLSLESEDGEPLVFPTPTPLPVSLKNAICYDASDGGMWCFVTLFNPGERALENASAWLNLSDSNGEVIVGKIAIPPLNLIPSGSELPLAAFVSRNELVDASGDPIPQFELMSALVVEDENRYLPVEAQIVEQEITSERLRAVVRGEIYYTPQPAPTATPDPEATPEGTQQAPPEPPTAESVWLALVAYDREGRVVGMRKWEASKSLKPGEHIPFEITLYSLGPPIERMQLFAEGRP